MRQFMHGFRLTAVRTLCVELDKSGQAQIWIACWLPLVEAAVFGGLEGSMAALTVRLSCRAWGWFCPFSKWEAWK